jgi:hypothetical protein
MRLLVIDSSSTGDLEDTGTFDGPVPLDVFQTLRGPFLVAARGAFAFQHADMAGGKFLVRRAPTEHERERHRAPMKLNRAVMDRPFR